MMAQLQISLKRIAIVLLSVAVVLCILLTVAFLRSRPPREKDLIQNFYSHRAAYEQLKDMLRQDKQVLRVANWGIETTGSPFPTPAEGKLPPGRYEEYVALLKQINGSWAFRDRGEHPEVVGVGVWASGFGGDTRHIQICWVDQAPANQVASLDDYYRRATRPRDVYRHIDDNWYLFADW